MHFHLVAEALRYLHSEAGGSLRHLKHTQVARAATNNATRNGYSFTFKEPVSMVVPRPARPQPAATATFASLGLTSVRCVACGANICGVTHSFTRCNAIVNEVCMARVETKVHCLACTCRACKRALTAHLVQCWKCNFWVHCESTTHGVCTLCSAASPSGGSATVRKPRQFNQKWLLSRAWLRYEYRVVLARCPGCPPRVSANGVVAQAGDKKRLREEALGEDMHCEKGCTSKKIMALMNAAVACMGGGDPETEGRKVQEATES